MEKLFDTRISTWSAWFPTENYDGLIQEHQVIINRSRFTDCRVHDRCDCDPWTYCYAYIDDTGWWPGTSSDEWIEYIPEVP